MKRITAIAFLFFGILFSVNSDANAQTAKRVQFVKGANSAVLKGTITAYKYVDYIIKIRAGQVLSLDIFPNSKAQLVIFEPSGDNMPDAAGVSGITTQIDEAGDYTVRVLMPRSFARRKNASANFTLKIKIENMR